MFLRIEKGKVYGNRTLKTFFEVFGVLLKSGAAKEATYTTGQFAKLCGVKKQTLFHYDDIGLLEPALVQENGYRRYSPEQYHVFLLISCLKETGMSLTEIKGYLNEKDDLRREGILRSAMDALDEKIAHLERSREVLTRAFPTHNRRADGQDAPAGLRLERLEGASVLVSPDLTRLDDKELVETVAAIVKVTEPFASCLRSSDVMHGIYGDPVSLLVLDDGTLSDEVAVSCGLQRTRIEPGTYARFTSDRDLDSEEFYLEFLSQLADANMVPGRYFIEEYQAAGEEDETPFMSAIVRVK